jgi:hypothetical protein
MKWMQEVKKGMEQRGTVGAFTKQAKRAGAGVQEFARHVLANKDEYSTKTVKRANLARTFSKFARHSPKTVITINGQTITLDTGKPSQRGDNTVHGGD